MAEEMTNKVEKDFIDFDTGYRIIIMEMSIPIMSASREMTWFCGYVGVPSDNKAFNQAKKTQKFPELHVFGGITFTGDLVNIQDDDRFFIGFDTNHVGGHNLVLADVEAECHKLAQQIYELSNPLEQIFKEALK